MALKVYAPFYPWFRPSDAPSLVQRFRLEETGGAYQYYEWETSMWFEGSPDTPSRNVKSCGALHFRTIGVTQAPGMPPLSRVPDAFAMTRYVVWTWGGGKD